jgi:hypothetical protein
VESIASDRQVSVEISMDDEVMQNLLSIGGAIFFLLAGSGLVFYTGEFREYERKHYGASK